MVLSCVRRLFPRLKNVTLLLGTRVDAAAFSERMAELAMQMDFPGVCCGVCVLCVYPSQVCVVAMQLSPSRAQTPPPHNT